MTPVLRARPRTATLRHAGVARASLVAAVALIAAHAHAAPPRCDIALQNNVCLEANPNCPAVASPVGASRGDWPVFQGNVQHTGQSPVNGPTCNASIWSTRLVGRILSSPVLAEGNRGKPRGLFVPVGKAPI